MAYAPRGGARRNHVGTGVAGMSTTQPDGRFRNRGVGSFIPYQQKRIACCRRFGLIATPADRDHGADGGRLLSTKADLRRRGSWPWCRARLNLSLA
jgi:hypothetical protein